MREEKNQNKNHIPVLVSEVLRYLAPQAGESYLDLTAGYGGHAAAVLERTRAPERMSLVDRDENAIRELAPFEAQGSRLVHGDFLSAGLELVREGRRFDLILADLGVSSPHLNEGNRGFAISATGPLDMRMDQRQTLTAAEIVNGWDVPSLADILRRYGEEPRAQKIARLIADNRPFTTTTDLAEVVARAWPGHSRVHPATRTFQALRIAVNDELRLIRETLPICFDLLTLGGRIAVISFHSLEDRLVKEAFAEAGGNRYDARLRVLTKRPVTATPSETVSNPRARSARLRAAVKINT